MSAMKKNATKKKASTGSKLFSRAVVSIAGMAYLIFIGDFTLPTRVRAAPDDFFFVAFFS